MNKEEFEEMYKPGALFYIKETGCIAYTTGDMGIVFLSKLERAYKNEELSFDLEHEVTTFDTGSWWAANPHEIEYIGNIADLHSLMEEKVNNEN